MIKRLFVVMFVLLGSLFVAGPAHASEWYDSDINYHNRGPSGHDDDGKVRISVWYNTDNDGDGYTIKRVRIDCWPDFAFEQSGNKVEGTYVSLQNENNVVFFERTGQSTDLGQNCEQNWWPDIHRPGSNQFSAAYSYKARLDGAGDPFGRVVVNCPCRPV